MMQHLFIYFHLYFLRTKKKKRKTEYSRYLYCETAARTTVLPLTALRALPCLEEFLALVCILCGQMRNLLVHLIWYGCCVLCGLNEVYVRI